MRTLPCTTVAANHLIDDDLLKVYFANLQICCIHINILYISQNISGMSKKSKSRKSNCTNGCVFILCNQRTKLAKAEKLKEFWIDTLHCDLFGDKIHQRMNGSDMKQMFEKLAVLDNASKYYYLVVVIIAKGGLVETKDDAGLHDVYVSGCDDCWLSEKKILSHFYNTNRLWLNKPKFFILDYDRLNKVEGGRLLDTERNRSKPSSPPARSLYPSISDVLLVYGSSNDIIKQITDVFSKNYKTESIMQLLTKVCQNINAGKGQPEIVVHSSLTEYRMHDETRQFQLYPTWYQYKSGSSGMTSGEELMEEFVKKGENESKPKKACVLIVSNPLGPINNPSGDVKAEHERDSEMMKELWEDKLKCNLYKDCAHENKSDTEMKELLKGIATWKDTDAYKYVVVVISGHGGLTEKGDLLQPYFRGRSKSERVLEREILHYFMGEKSAWKDKVKIFILDYCRGTKRDRGVSKTDAMKESETKEYENGKYHPEKEILPPSITTMPNDSYVVYSTHANYEAYANRLTGFIHEVFMDHWDEFSLVELLTEVNSRMKKAGPSKKAMSLFKTTAGVDFRLYDKAENAGEDFDRWNSDTGPKHHFVSPRQDDVLNSNRLTE